MTTRAVFLYVTFALICIPFPVLASLKKKCLAILCVPGENEAFKLIFMFHADTYQSWVECVQRKASNCCTLYSRIIPISHKIPGSADGEKEIYNGSAWIVGTIHSAKITHRQG